MNLLSLFSGCGGFDLGASQAGFNTKLALDIDPVAIATLVKNLECEAVTADLTKLDLDILPRDIDLVVGGPPCQGFSSAGPKRDDDPRNKLWGAYLNVLSHVMPKSFIIENVPGFEKELKSLLDEINFRFGNKYRIESKKIVSQYYGVPQFRHRLFVIGIRDCSPDTILWPTPDTPEVFNYTRPFEGMITLQSMMEDLGPPAAYRSHDPENDSLDHRYVPLNVKDAWIAQRVFNGGSLKDIPDKYLPEPYFGRARGPKGWTWYYRKPRLDLPARSVIANIRPNFSTILAPDVTYSRVDGRWFLEPVNRDEHTSADGLYLSPVEPRRLSVRECARIQSFPDSYRFEGKPLEKHRQIGNAVPVELARRLCSHVRQVIERG